LFKLLAIQEDRYEILEYLIVAGADANRKNKFNVSPVLLGFEVLFLN
jgi:hypothetical protein